MLELEIVYLTSTSTIIQQIWQETQYHIEIYKYSQETEAKVQEYRYYQSHQVGHAVSWVDHRKRRWVLLVLVSYVVCIKVHM